MKEDLGIRTIKACDWLDNMRSWSYISKSNPAREKFKRWFKEAETMYIPFAKSVNDKIVKEMKIALAKAKLS